MNMTRRQVLQSSLGSLLAAGLWPGALSAGDKDTGTFQFIAVNDLHYLNDKCGPWFERMVKGFKTQPEKTDFVLVSGDFVEHGTSQEHGAIVDILKTLGMPYYAVPGNHDYQTQTDRKAYDQLHLGRLNYHFEHQGWQFIGLDTSEGMKSQRVNAPKATFDWLDEHLPKLDQKKPTVIFTHFPLGFGVPFILQNANDILKRFLPFNLQAVYSGHYHGFTEKKAGEVVMTTNKCCSFARGNHDKTPEKGYFVCSAKDGKVARRFVELK